MYTLHTGDCLDIMASMDGIDAIVTDPPYGIKFLSKQWDHGIPGVDFWTEAIRILKPSHYLLSFGGTRTWHRLACALEDAGFEIRDTLMWLYGTGFPKSGASLKPAWEPILLARKPGPMRELGIDDCRIEARDVMHRSRHNGTMGHGGNKEPFVTVPHPFGRYPANLIVDEEVAELIGPPSRLFYCPKASSSERNAGLEGLEKRKSSKLGDGFASCVGHPNPNAQGHTSSGDRKAENYHPTVKPIALMRWLVKLVSREGETVLDPFMGSGTTGIACVLENRDFIGIEREPDYIEIAKRRIAHHAQRLPV